MRFKYVILTIVLIAAVYSPSFAEEFQPTLLKLDHQDIIFYGFDSSELEIPVTVSGTPCSAIFAVFSEDQGSDIGSIENGFLGWHYVNNIDTCVYYSRDHQLDIGDNVITWNGRDQDGNPIIKYNVYSYYIWAYDNVSKKQRMCKYGADFSRLNWKKDLVVQELDEDGFPLRYPFWYRAHERWKIGHDPEDEKGLISSDIVLEDGWKITGMPEIRQDDFNFLYICVTNTEEKKAALQKLRFIPGGETEIASDWGEEVPYSKPYDVYADYGPGVISDGEYLYAVDNNIITSNEPDADIYIYDMNGFMIEHVDLTPWWSNEHDFKMEAQMNGGPSYFDERRGRIVMNSHASCLVQMIEPARFLDNGMLSDLILWSNGNGDYFYDKNFEVTAKKSWVCNDYNVEPSAYSISLDYNFFSIVPVNDYENYESFGIFAPDGTGLGNFSLAGEGKYKKSGHFFIDCGTPYDGLYCDNVSSLLPHGLYTADAVEKFKGIFYIAHDSVKGVISPPYPGVENTTPTAITLSQNSPNPFNPVTSIAFTLPKDSHVSLVVYDIGGRKIATLMDGNCSAGKHSVDWNASEFASGIYFCRMEAGGVSETRKMTLLK